MEQFEQPVDEITRISTQLASGQIHDDAFRSALQQEGRHTDKGVKNRIDAALQLAYTYDRLAHDASQEPDNQVYFNSLWRDAVVYAANLASSDQGYFFDKLSAFRHQDAATTGRIVNYLKENAPAQASRTCESGKVEKSTKPRSSTADTLRRFGRPVAVAAGVVAGSILAPHTAVAADTSHTPGETKNTKVVDKAQGVDLGNVHVEQLATPTQPSVDAESIASKDQLVAPAAKNLAGALTDQQAASPVNQKAPRTELPAKSDQTLTPVPLETQPDSAAKPSVVSSAAASMNAASARIQTPEPTADVPARLSASPNQDNHVTAGQDALPLAKETVDLDQLQTDHTPVATPASDIKTISASDVSDFKVTEDHHTIAIDNLVTDVPPSAQNQLEVPTQSSVASAPSLDDIPASQVEAPQLYTPPSQAPLPAPAAEVPAAPQIAAPATPAPEKVPSSAPTAEAGPYTLNADQQGLIDSLNLAPAKKDFLKQVAAGAIGLRQHGSNINPEVVIAQAILESAWGGSQLTTQAHNYFGMKAGADWKGKTVVMPTQEVENGQWITVNATWKAFDTAEDCFGEYAKFIANSPNFKDALAYPDDPVKYVQALLNRDNGQSAYATDPDYAAKILGTVRANHIDQVVNIARKAQSDKATADKAASDKKAADTHAAEAAAKKVETAAFSGWVSPVEGNPPITSGFGERGTGANKTFHSGIDYGLSTGHNLFAMGTGVVKTVVTGDVRTQQWCINALASVGASTADVKDPIQKEVYVRVTADDGHTYDIIYAHLSKINVTDGQVVHAGESIGESGGSGCSTGDHVHIEVHQDGKAIDPHVLLGNLMLASSAIQPVGGGEGAASPMSDEYGDGFVVPDSVVASLNKSDNDVTDRAAALRRLSMIKERINAG